MSFCLPCSTTVPTFKTIRGDPWKNIQKFVELTWNDPIQSTIEKFTFDVSMVLNGTERYRTVPNGIEWY